MSPEQFREIAVREFAFLVNDFGCAVSFPPPKPTDPEWAVGYDVSFTNATTAIDVELQFIEHLPLIRLRRAQPLPEQVNTVPLGILLIVRAPELNPLRDVSGLPVPKDVETLLGEYARALAATGVDILTGDFGVFPQLAREARMQMERRANRTTEKFVFF